jgi:pyridoxal phosphate enzyme (YggS family)
MLYRKMSIHQNLQKIKSALPTNVTLVAISKTKPVEAILEAYHCGQHIFGENKVQEMCDKQLQLPTDIQWHIVGHLQSNKVKYIAPFVSLIHSVDSLKLLQEINKQAAKNNRIIDCLLQIYIAQEETKFGLNFEEAEQLLSSSAFQELKNIRIVGLMGMASNTDNVEQVRMEFRSLKNFFDKIQNQESRVKTQDAILSTQYPYLNTKISILSMGMSSDYTIAIEEGSTMVRIGSSVFGERDYAH